MVRAFLQILLYNKMFSKASEVKYGKKILAY
nr:MAG TPA: hypothetical protein [Caudoviricetes sp.]